MSAEIEVLFKTSEGDMKVKGKEGESLLEVAHKNGVPLEGSCEGSLACSTCHVVLEQEVYSKLEEATEDEEDMLDMAFGLTSTSRLGCQIILSKELEGAVFKIPSKTRNLA